MDSIQMEYQTVGVTGSEPIDLTTAKQFCRIDYTNTDNDMVLTALLAQARQMAESIMAKALTAQTIQVLYTLPQIPINTLSGVQLAYDRNFYQYNESLGANPFSPAPWLLKVPFPPLVSVNLFEYRTFIFDPWTTWPQIDPTSGNSNYTLETTQQPGVVWIQYPPPAYQYRLTCAVGYSTLPADIKLLLLQAVSALYENRDQPLSANIQQALFAKRNHIL